MTSGIEITLGDVWGGLDLWLALNEPDMARLAAIGDAAGRGLVPALIAHPGQAATLALLGERGLAALVPGQDEDDPGAPFPIAVRGLGPGGGKLAQRLVGHIRAWDRHERPSTTDLQIRAYPTGAEIEGAVVIDKRHTRIALDWR